MRNFWYKQKHRSQKHLESTFNPFPPQSDQSPCTPDHERWWRCEENTHDGLDPSSWKTRKKRPAASSSFHRFVGFFIRRDGSPLLLGFPIMCRHHAARWHVLLGSCPWPITTSQACSPWPDMLTWTSGALGRDARKERERGLKGCERPVCVCVDILCVLPFSLPTTTFQTSPYVSCLATFLPVDSF